MDGNPRLEDRVVAEHVPEQLAAEEALGPPQKRIFARAFRLRHLSPGKCTDVDQRPRFLQAVVPPPEITAFVLHRITACCEVLLREIAENRLVLSCHRVAFFCLAQRHTSRAGQAAHIPAQWRGFPSCRWRTRGTLRAGAAPGESSSESPAQPRRDLSNELTGRDTCVPFADSSPFPNPQN